MDILTTTDDESGGTGGPVPTGRATTAPTRGQAALAGAAAAAVALGVGELIASLGGPDESLVISVGDRFVDRFAASLKDVAVALFGTNDKAALVIGIVVVSLVAGALLGLAARRRFVWATAGFVAFGVVGLFAARNDAQASSAFALAASAGAVAAGLATLAALFRVARTGRPLPVTTTASAGRSGRQAEAATAAGGARTADTPTTPHADRRAFFAWTGAAGAFAAVTAAGSRALAERTGVESARQAVKLPAATAGDGAGTTTTAAPGETIARGAGTFDIDGLTPYIVANDDFYRIDTALVTPQVDPADWSLTVTGMVERPFTLTFDELLAMDMVTETVTLMCVSNEVGDDLVGNAVWQGVPLKALLDRAGVLAGAEQVFTTSVDGWTCGFPTELVMNGRTALVAVGMNGEPLPVRHGFPARLVVAGLYGYVSATKWVTEIRLAPWEGLDGYWMPRGWSKEGPVKTQSRIDVPRQRATLAAGRTPIAGVAWAPSRGIRRVEVQVDDGPWRDATLGEVASANTWVQWVLDWDATPGEHRIRVRATDGTGETQTEEIAPPAPDGATGWHTRTVTVVDG